MRYGEFNVVGNTDINCLNVMSGTAITQPGLTSLYKSELLTIIIDRSLKNRYENTVMLHALNQKLIYNGSIYKLIKDNYVNTFMIPIYKSYNINGDDVIETNTNTLSPITSFYKIELINDITTIVKYGIFNSKENRLLFNHSTNGVVDDIYIYELR